MIASYGSCCAVIDALEPRMLFAVTVPPSGSGFGGSDVDLAVISSSSTTVVVKSREHENRGFEVHAEVYNAAGERTNRFALDYFPNGEERHAVVAAQGSEFVVAWERLGGAGRNSIQARRYLTDGTMLTEQITVASGYSGSAFPSIAANISGDFVIAYTLSDEQGDSDVFARMYNRNAERTATVKIANTALHESQPSVAMNLARNGFDVAYTVEDRTGDTDIFLKRFNGDGELRRNSKFKVAASGDDEFLPSLSISPDGSKAIVGWSRLLTDDAPHQVQARARQYAREGVLPQVHIAQTGVGSDPSDGRMDVAINNSGVSVAAFGGTVYEDIERLTDEQLTTELDAFLNPAVAVGTAGNYAAAAIDDLNGEEDKVIRIMFGSLPTP